MFKICGSCHDWITHMQANGLCFTVHDTGNNAVHTRLGLPQKLESFHTALVRGYLIEGHVPANDIHELLLQKNKALRPTGQGMPVGSPGMDGAMHGGRSDPYDALLVAHNGGTRIFKSYPPKGLFMKPSAQLLATLLLTSALGPAMAQAPALTNKHNNNTPAAVPGAQGAQDTPDNGWADQIDLSEGEVVRWDPRTLKVTLRHGEIKNLSMPPMTMVFHVQDKGMVGSLQPGDKVRFRAEHVGGTYVLTRLQAAP